MCLGKRVIVGSDHAGMALRTSIVEHLGEQGFDIVDVLGPTQGESTDYPVVAGALTHVLTAHEADWGVLVCGTGIGMSIAANRCRGIRAALCTNEYLAQMTRAHNDANVLCLGERVIGVGAALSVVDRFAMTPYEAGRHARRVEALDA